MVDQIKKGSHVSDEIQLVIFRLADEEFGIQISQVKEIIRLQEITPMPKSPDFIEGVINLRGQIIAVMDLASRFGLAKAKRTDSTRIVVGEVADRIVGLVVDEVPEVLRIQESSIDPTPGILESQIHAEFIRGVGKLDDRLIIILEASRILSVDEMGQVVAAASETEAV